MTNKHALCEAVTLHASRAGEQLRAHGSVCGVLLGVHPFRYRRNTVFLRKKESSVMKARHRRNDSLWSARVVAFVLMAALGLSASSVAWGAATSKRLKIVNGCSDPIWIFYLVGSGGGVLWSRPISTNWRNRTTSLHTTSLTKGWREPGSGREWAVTVPATIARSAKVAARRPADFRVRGPLDALHRLIPSSRVRSGASLRFRKATAKRTLQEARFCPEPTVGTPVWWTAIRFHTRSR